MSGIPEEIIEENILTRLPVKSISRFRCVSRNWNLLFRNPNFTKKHLNHANLMNKFNILVTNFGAVENSLSKAYLYSVDNNVSLSSSSSSPFPASHAVPIDYPFMSQIHVPEIIGSCNGLVCIEALFADKCIWNPATREYTTVPLTETKFPSDDIGINFWRYGFGFDCKNDDYKLLRIVVFTEGEVSEARIYSLASESWKELGFIPYDFSDTTNDGFHFNGVLYWLADVHGLGIKSRVTVGFDISDETFHDFPLPDDILNADEDNDVSSLGIWEGKLCLFHSDYQNYHINAWTMTDNKWSKHLKITTYVREMFYGCPIQTLQSGEILVKEGLPRRDGVIALLSYDPALQRVTPLKINGFPDQYDQMEPYIETLVALNSGTYVGK